MKRGFTVWLTGYSGSGKTTLTLQLQQRMLERNTACERVGKFKIPTLCQ